MKLIKSIGLTVILSLSTWLLSGCDKVEDMKQGTWDEMDQVLDKAKESLDKAKETIDSFKGGDTTEPQEQEPEEQIPTPPAEEANENEP